MTIQQMPPAIPDNESAIEAFAREIAELDQSPRYRAIRLMQKWAKRKGTVLITPFDVVDRRTDTWELRRHDRSGAASACRIPDDELTPDYVAEVIKAIERHFDEQVRARRAGEGEK